MVFSLHAHSKYYFTLIKITSKNEHGPFENLLKSSKNLEFLKSCMPSCFPLGTYWKFISVHYFGVDKISCQQQFYNRYSKTRHSLHWNVYSKFLNRADSYETGNVTILTMRIYFLRFSLKS